MAPSVDIEGPVLLLMGPIGTFFARLAEHLNRGGVPVWKVSFPLHEFGYSNRERLAYDGSMDDFQSFLLEQIESKGIRHLFMYGDFIDPHRLAIELVQRLNAQPERQHKLDAWVFELGYIRPNYISLERERCNARSSLNRPAGFYRSLPEANSIPKRTGKTELRWRKCWKTPTFIQHAFTAYPIIKGPHKLQPRPSYLLAQLRGLVRKHIYQVTERKIRLQLQDGRPYILVPLQVASDSQISLGSDYQGMEPFIKELITSFAIHGRPCDRLAFKHHPRDRGYNNYSRLIDRLATTHGVRDRVVYFHDAPLGPALKAARAVVTINSTVGLQALYHGTPTKALGRTFYNLHGLTDQQPLSEFWSNPHGQDRSLFQRFYNYLIESTQIRGNFDGYFPFADTFRISPNLAIQTTPRNQPNVLQVWQRLLVLGRGFATYYLQLLAIAVGAKTTARRLLEGSARDVMAGLGVQVHLEQNQLDQGQIDQPRISIANHGHPLDVLLIQGYFRQCSMTTAANHLRHILPLFRHSAENYGHIHLNHLCPTSRIGGLRRLMRMMQRHGRLFLFPSGSLVTPITERVSGSLYLLARRNKALIIPWILDYEGFESGEGDMHYRPLAMMRSRLSGPKATIRCREGDPINPLDFSDEQSFCDYVRQYYRDHLNPSLAH
ncbi:MAG: 1-acyl-sn-glycerol-3-phosphate acyltransferase [Cyanobacteria bacterium]|nr:1-acyl-sn-glycerol-3-phosphate acyltransferase [Cyanobacteriota bacterium]